MSERGRLERTGVLAGWTLFAVLCAAWARDLEPSHDVDHFLASEAAPTAERDRPFVALGFEFDDALDPVNLATMMSLHRALEQAPGVAGVLSLPGFIGAPPALPESRRAQIASQADLAGNLITPDRRRAAMWVTLDRAEALTSVEAVIEAHPQAGIDHVAGSAVFTGLFDRMLQRDLLVIAPLLLGIIGVGIGLLFRRAMAVLGCVAVVSIGLLASTLPMSLLGLPMTILSLTALPVVAGAALGVAVHWLWAWRRLGEPEAVAREIAAPCAWTTVTTGVAMGSLALSGYPALISMGLSAAVGVLVTFPLTFTLFPLLLHSHPPCFAQAPRPGVHLPRLPPTAHRALWGAFAVIALAMALGLPHLTAESNIALALPGSIPLRRAEGWFEEGFGGLIPLTVTVAGPLAGQADAAEATLHHLREQVSAGMVPMSAEGDPFRAQVRLPEVPSARLATLRDRIRSDVGSLWPEGHEVILSGAVPRLLSSMHGMLQSLAVSLLTALGMIAVLMMVALRSVRWGLVSMIPNAVPIICTLGLIGWARRPIDLATTSVGCAALGVAVDDTIHMLHRHRWSRSPGESMGDAHRRFLCDVGPALVITTALSIVGFAVLALSIFEPLRWFGLWAAVALGMALLLDLALLPSLLKLMEPKERLAC